MDQPDGQGNGGCCYSNHAKDDELDGHVEHIVLQNIVRVDEIRLQHHFVQRQLISCEDVEGVSEHKGHVRWHQPCCEREQRGGQYECKGVTLRR